MYSAAVLGLSLVMSAQGGHSFVEGAVRLCACQLCLALIRLGRAVTGSGLGGQFAVPWTQRIQLLGVEIQDAAEYYRAQALPPPGAPPPVGIPPPPPVQVGRGFAAPTPWQGRVVPREPAQQERKEESKPEPPREERHKEKKEPKEKHKEKDSHKRGKEHRERTPIASRGSKDKEEEPRESRKEKKRRSRSPRRTRKEKEEEVESKEAAAKRIREEKAAPASLVPVKKEPESEGEDIEEGEESEAESDPVEKEPERAPRDSSCLPGAERLPRPLSAPDLERPALERRRQEEYPGRRRHWEPKPRFKVNPKGKKKRERQEAVRRAGGLRNWYATKKNS